MATTGIHICGMLSLLRGLENVTMKYPFWLNYPFKARLPTNSASSQRSQTALLSSSPHTCVRLLCACVHVGVPLTAASHTLFRGQAAKRPGGLSRILFILLLILKN